VPLDLEQAVVDTVVARLVEKRIKKRISQNRLAELTGLSRSGIRHLEAGETNPTLYTLLKIARVLDVKLGRIIGAIIRAQ
jgi:transcriptional regulator with XRE-family HTH domain